MPGIDPTPPPSDWTPEERLQALLPRETCSPDVSNISVAVAATARLNPSFLDPSLAEPEATGASPATEPTQTTEPPTLPPTLSAPEDTNTPPWGEISYVASPAPGPLLNESLVAQMTHSRGGVRMDTSDGHGRPRNSRARFSPARRKEVQEIRKIGACIRCRILRKNCGKGDPCDTCKKVLSPRVWRVGCVRTRLHEQLDLYSAGVQVVLSQNRLNVLKQQLKPVNNGTTLQVSHFPETDILIDVPTMCAMVDPSEALSAMPDDIQPAPRVIMIDQDAALIPEMVEQYMRSALPLFIERETSGFMKTTLVTAQEQYEETEEDVLKKALELWGLVEIIDRERQWTFLEKPAEKDRMPRWIKEASDAPNGSDADIYTMLCMQLNAAAERKANQTSKSLLGLMHRLLQDSKTRINFRMYIASLIFLNCVEKSTWAFKAWEQAHLRPGWPLERDPSVFMQQGSDLANLLRMLLGIRKALPDTERSEDGKLKSRDHDPEAVRFFERLDLDCELLLPWSEVNHANHVQMTRLCNDRRKTTLMSRLSRPSIRAHLSSRFARTCYCPANKLSAGTESSFDLRAKRICNDCTPYA